MQAPLKFETYTKALEFGKASFPDDPIRVCYIDDEGFSSLVVCNMCGASLDPHGDNTCWCGGVGVARKPKQ